MGSARSFRFAEDALNRRLIALLKKSRITHSVDGDGVIHYSPDDEEAIENDLICSVRDRVFDGWQVLTCPEEWVERYRRYMARHHIPFQEELANGALWFLLPRRYRPHRWKLDDEPATAAK